uniref:hypothetical protein n=1 Tax=Endozoicomonas sp. YOMI1 TaxID=2828739 RepID=UPI0021475CE9
SKARATRSLVISLQVDSESSYCRLKFMAELSGTVWVKTTKKWMKIHIGGVRVYNCRQFMTLTLRTLLKMIQ